MFLVCGTPSMIARSGDFFVALGLFFCTESYYDTRSYFQQMDCCIAEKNETLGVETEHKMPQSIVCPTVLVATQPTPSISYILHITWRSQRNQADAEQSSNKLLNCYYHNMLLHFFLLLATMCASLLVSSSLVFDVDCVSTATDCSVLYRACRSPQVQNHTQSVVQVVCKTAIMIRITTGIDRKLLCLDMEKLRSVNVRPISAVSK